MTYPVDPAVAEALERAVGHGPPLTDAEWEQVTELHIAHARSLDGIARCRSLEMLILNGCDPVETGMLADLTGLAALVVNNSGLASLEGVEGLPLLQVDVSRNLVEDLSPLLKLSDVQNINVDGNPLSVESYERVIPELRRRGARVTCSERREWQLTLRLQEAGLPFCCYRKAGKVRLNSPGLRHTEVPEFGHPVVTENELERLLAENPDGVYELFARRDHM
ncbi:hypothetical protein GA0074695_2985 [Micromonospora viridifaciens]|uniref:Leucine-rich repeat domain-containing protein n=1 Tax=Micromonospora viridifaciens TaxID=1881 RepID=A0A1C4X3X3_MICVI|nr:leucine-rich repeat domain-containing protein [Micromonospora viridifaciens]SCF03114.1 hypothetical protein GA0074695_2985 [Micromonospora viridifaciens]